MDRHELVATLAQLHAELSRTDRADPETLELLRNLTSDIDRLLSTDEPVEAADADPVTTGLKDLLLKFEAEHPQLSTAIGKVADALAAIGI
jgi:hypothetical protein